MEGSVLSVSSRALVDACRRLGLDTRPILLAANLEESALADPDARIPISQMQALWRKAYEVSGDPDLALHAVEVLPFGAYRVLDFLAATAPTIGGAFAKVSAYFPLINTEVRLPYDVGPREVTFGVEAPSHPGLISRPYAEYTLAAVVLRLRIGTGQPFALVRVEFSHPAPADTREHVRVFDCPVRFDCSRCQLVLTREVWDGPRLGAAPADSALFSVLDSHAQLLLERVPQPVGVVARVREAIAGELRGGDPRLSTIARHLAMSPRTLQRHLDRAGVAFSDLVDERRFAAAKSYLAKPDVAAAEVASLLGFAEQSAFTHAFRRWSGVTPTEYRRRGSAVGPSAVVTTEQ